MTLRHNRAIILVGIVLLVVAWGVYQTDSQPTPPAPRTTRRAPSDRAIVVDQSSLVTAELLVHLPTTADEKSFAEEALRVADNEMDLAFAQAVRRTANQPRATSDTAKEADARLQKALRALAADQAQAEALEAAVKKANVAEAEALTDKLNLANAQAALDQDEVDDARQDLRRAGGDPQGRMEDMIAEHEAASKSADTVHIVVTNAAGTSGLVRHLRALRALKDKEALLRKAMAQADSLAIAFRQRHDRVEARAAALMRDSAVRRLSRDSAAVLLEATRRRALDGRIRAMLDQRIDNQHRLSAAYAGWTGVIVAQERAVLNRVLRSVLLILVIVIVGIILLRWSDHVIAERVIRAHAAHLVTRVSLQLIAVLLIAFVIFGPPDNLGTILGLVGAGLTVALKDFIIGFMGWFVLMGKNGIRPGDLVEINGVTGEVEDVGMFRTVLLETGNWTESGHPTGRRVTFGNSFAVEGHYFNFSTAGRWLWDEVRIAVPVGRDPYPIAAALQKQVEEATSASAREAESQWSTARGSAKVAAPATSASVSLRPVGGGVEITVRYITRVTEREGVRAALYHTAVHMLGDANVPGSAADPAPVA